MNTGIGYDDYLGFKVGLDAKRNNMMTGMRDPGTDARVHILEVYDVI